MSVPPDGGELRQHPDRQAKCEQVQTTARKAGSCEGQDHEGKQQQYDRKTHGSSRQWCTVVACRRWTRAESMAFPTTVLSYAILRCAHMPLTVSARSGQSTPSRSIISCAILVMTPRFC